MIEKVYKAAHELPHEYLPAVGNRLVSRRESELMGIDTFCLSWRLGEGSAALVSNRNQCGDTSKPAS